MAKKKHFKFPTAYTVIIIVLFAVELLTLAIPSGKYATLQYDHSSETFFDYPAKWQKNACTGHAKDLESLPY